MTSHTAAPAKAPINKAVTRGIGTVLMSSFAGSSFPRIILLQKGGLFKTQPDKGVFVCGFCILFLGKLVLFPVSAPRLFKDRDMRLFCLEGLNSKVEEEVKNRSHHRLLIYGFFIPSCNTFVNVHTYVQRYTALNHSLPYMYKPVCGYSDQSITPPVYHKSVSQKILTLRPYTPYCEA